MKKFDITYFCGPTEEYIVKPEIVADIAASGITLVPLGYSTEVNKQALRLLSAYGLRGFVHDDRVGAIYYKDDLAAADRVVKEVVADYAEFDNLIGWDIVDEPNASKFPMLAAIVNAFRRYSPDKETVINLFPNYASPEQLGNPDYISHLEAFTNIVRPHLISYDHYHFLGRENRNKTILENIDERERLIRLSAETTENRGGFFENIEDIRNIGLKYGIDTMLIVLLIEHGPYRNLTFGELSWEVNMCLAYGMRRISYFTYWQPGPDEHWQWDNSMVNRKGEKFPHWYDVQKLNAAIRDAGNYLFDYDTAAVFHIGTPESGAKAFTPFGGITAIDGENGVIGFFENGAVYLVNRDFQKENTFTLHSDRPMTVRRDGVFVDVPEKTGFTVTLSAGEGILLKL